MARKKIKERKLFAAPESHGKREEIPAANRRGSVAPKFNWYPLALLLLVSLSLYGLTLRNNFVTDDKLQILSNPNVKDPQNLTQAFRGDVWSFATQKNSKKHRGTNYYRPLQLLTYMAEYSAFGEKSWPWHLMNMVLNAIVVALVYLLLTLLAEPALAFWAALLFALHPIHTEAVAWVAALPELECALFLLLALIFYHRARKGTASAGSLAFSTLFLAAALLSKEVALLFPFVLVAYEWFFRGADGSQLLVDSRRISKHTGADLHPENSLLPSLRYSRGTLANCWCRRT